MRIGVTPHTIARHHLLRSELLGLFPESVFNEDNPKPSPQEVLELVRNCDGVIVGLENVTDALLEKCPRLRIVSKYGVGLDNIDLEACKKRGIIVGWTPGVNRRAVAELTLAFMLALLRNIVPGCNSLKKGDWQKYGGAELTGKTVGVIGVGYIGKDLIRLLKPFECRILCNDLLDQQEFYAMNGVISASKDEIYAEADIVSLHTPLTDLTRNIINREVLARMRKTAYIINTARGAIINKADLKLALSEGRIAGAALDVYPEEPETDLEFLGLPSLLCTPHRAGSSKEAVLAMGRCAISHLRNYFLSAKSRPEV